MGKGMTNADLIAAITGKVGVRADRGLAEGEESALEFLGSMKPKTETQREKEARVKKEQEELRASLTPLQILLTDITGGRLPSSGINHVIERYAEDHWAEEYRVDIPAVDENFRWEPDVLEAAWLAYIMKERCLFIGPPGTGKTTVTRQLAAWIRQPYARFNGKDGIDGSAFLGQQWASKEGMCWKDGLMTIAVREGYFTVIDEIFKLPPGIQMCMQSLYEKDGFLMLDEKPGTIADKHIYPKEEFTLFGTDNTKGTGDGLGSYAASMIQDVSSLDRFGITVEVHYLRVDDEVAMLKKKFPGVQESRLKKVVSFANLVRNGFKTGDISLTLSPRGCSVICQLLERSVDMKKALSLVFVNKLGSESEVATVEKFITGAI